MISSLKELRSFSFQGTENCGEGGLLVFKSSVSNQVLIDCVLLQDCSVELKLRLKVYDLLLSQPLMKNQ